MKQQVSFFETDSAKILGTLTHFLTSHSLEAFLGFVWNILAFSFVMFIYHWFAAYNKAKNDKTDNKIHKIAYRDIDKRARPIMVGFVMFSSLSLLLLCAIEDEFLRILKKGGICTAVILPMMHMYYSDEKRFRF